MMKQNKLTLTSIAIAVGVIALGIAGCDKKETGPAAAAASVKAASNKVEVAADGTRFDPPVSSDRIPDGAWMCEMKGEVHYAAKNKGDGKCPVCSMALVQKGTSGSVHMEGMGHAGNSGMH
ncbi:MAG: hypothetical protein AB7S68_16080 [Polyangiaceae bacterium]